MNPSELTAFLPVAWKAKRQILIKGPPGVGKTAIVSQAANDGGYGLVVSHPAIDDPTDYKGFPAKAADGEHATFLPFGNLWRVLKADKPTIWLIDDIGQASDSVQKALMQLIHVNGRRLNGHTLSDLVVIVGATNEVGHRAGVTGMLEPVKSRWETIIELTSDVNDWTTWAINNNMPPVLIAFLRTRPELLHKFEPTKEITNGPQPRTWEACGKWLNMGINIFGVLEGCVGKGPATEYLAFEKLADGAPSLDAILLNPDSEAVPEDPALRYVVAGGLAHRATRQNVSRVATYLARLPQPFRVLAYRDMLRRDKALASTAAFVEWVAKEGKDLV
jgi:hypothetical protein